MTNNTASEHAWALRPAAMVVAFVAMVVAALLAATPAWASSVSDVRVEFPTNRNQAGERAEFAVSFTTTSWLGPNDSITIDAPAGTVFPDGDGNGGNFLLYNLEDAQANHFIPTRNVALSNGGSTVTLSLEGISVYAPPGTRVTINNMVVTNPPEPGTYFLLVRTTKDSELAPSAPYTIVPAQLGGPQGPGGGEECTITGNDGDNLLRGTDGRDVICARGGDDIILGSGGNDLVLGGGGADTVQGGNGDDIVKGQDGNDTIQGNEGRDVLYGGAGRDTVQGGPGKDLVRGGPGKDVTQQ